MKVRIYKSGGSAGRFISKLERFLPTAAKGAQVDEMKQIKEAIKYQLDDKNQSASSVMLQLVRGGYDYATAKSLVDAAEEDLEESYYKKKSKKDSMLDSDVIPNEDEIESYDSEEDDRKKRKELSRNMQDDIAQTAQDASDDDSDDDQEYNEMLNEGSPYDDDLDTAAFGMEVDNSKIQWPGMFNDMSSFKNGGAPNKKKFINSTVKKLMKAKAGMETDPTANGMPNPYGTIDDPTGVDLTPTKSIVSAIKGTAQNYMDEQAYKQQAEQMYNQQFMQPTAAQGGENDWSTNLHNYGEALQHMMPNMNTTGINTSFSGDQMAFGGTRRVKRANKAFFGSPTALPGATTDYEFGPLGGLKKGKVEYDLGQMGQALKDNPQLAAMFMPQMAMGMPKGGNLFSRWASNNVPQFNPFGGAGYNNYGSSSSSSSSYSSSSPQSRLKWETQTVNNAADPSKNDEAGKLKNNADQTDQKKKYQDYIDWWGAEAIPEGDSRQVPVSFDEFTTKGENGLSEYDHYASGINASVSPTATVNAPVNVPGTTVTSPGSGTTTPGNTNTGNPPVVTTPGNEAPISEPTIDNETGAEINNPGQKGKTSEELGLDNSNTLYTKNRTDAAYKIKDGKYYISPNYSSHDKAVYDNWIEVTDPERIKQIKTFKPNQSRGYEGLRGSDFNYERDVYGDWSYATGNGIAPVTNPKSLERLNNNESIGSDFVTLESKPGYYYRRRNDGAYVKFKGEPSKHNNSKKAIATITEKSDPKAFEYIENNRNWGGGDMEKHSDYKPLGFKNPPGTQSKSKGPSTNEYFKMGYNMNSPTNRWPFAEGGFVDFEKPELNRFVYGGDEYAYGGGIRMFNNGGQNQMDPNYRDAGGRNYQDYIDWQGADAVPAGRSRQAPQTYAEWKAEQEADKKPAGTTNNQGNTGTTNYDQSYFQNMFKNDPKFKQGFEQFIQTQGYPTNAQRSSSNFSKGDGMGGADPRGAMQWTNNQGSQLVGTGPANRGFGSGLLGAVGLNKDFKAYYSPQGQITREMLAQAMKNGAGKVTETKFKDRGNRFNPFDNKKVTEWTIDPATGQPTPAATTPQGPLNNPGSTSMAPTNNVGPMNTGENTGIDQTPEDWQYNQPAMDYMRQSLSVGNNAGAPQGGDQNNMSSQGALSGVDGTQSTTANIPNTGVNEDIPKGMFLQTRREGDHQAGIDRKGRLVSRGTPPPVQPTAEQTEGANKFMNMFNGRASSQPAPSIPTFNQNSTGNYMDYRGSSQPAAAPTQPVSGIPYNTSGPMNIMDEETGMAYGGYMKQGGYIPEYMAYGGYMPDYGYGGMMQYNPGGTVVGPNPDFGGTQQNNLAEDKNGNKIPDYLEAGQDPAMGADAAAGPAKYRLEEENAWSWDPKKLATTMDTGLNIATGIGKKIGFAKNREKENSEFMYAQDVDRQLAYKGITDQEGVDKKAGYETGRTYTGKFGGAKMAKGGSTYAKGKLYSLTMDEINEIKNRGGSVKFIK